MAKEPTGMTRDTDEEAAEVSSLVGSMLDVSFHVPSEIEKVEEKGNSSWWDCRTTIGFMGFLGITVAYATRVSLSIAIVAMVGKNDTQFASANLTDVCPLPEGAEVTQESVEGAFDWDPQIQGLVLASFFYGYTCTNFLGGRAAEHYGGRKVFGLGIISCSFFTAISPFCAFISKEVFIVSRILQGMTQGVIFPSLHSLMASWAPPKERGKLITQTHLGIQVGTIVGMALGGWLCNSGFIGGWPLVFYVFGGLGMLWGIPWFLLIHDRPEFHPRISPEEMRYLQAYQSSTKAAQVVSIPWKAMLTSPPFWSIVFMNSSNSYGFYTLLTGLPTYFSSIQHFDLNQSGWMSALPYLVMWGYSMVWGNLMSWMAKKNIISLKNVRRISTAFACYGSALGLIAECFVGCNSTLALLAICVAVGMSGANFVGFYASYQDIAPNLAGTITGISNTCGALLGAVAPVINGAIINKNETMGSWRIVFLIAAVFWIITTTTYLFLITAKVQPWNEPTTKKETRWKGQERGI